MNNMGLKISLLFAVALTFVFGNPAMEEISLIYLGLYVLTVVVCLLIGRDLKPADKPGVHSTFCWGYVIFVVSYVVWLITNGEEVYQKNWNIVFPTLVLFLSIALEYGREVIDRISFETHLDLIRM